MRAAFALAGLLLLAGCVAPPADEELDKGDKAATPRGARAPAAWADPASALIHPGAIIQTEAGDCPSNFVFTRSDNESVYLGTTAYCVRDLPIGALATVGGPQEIAVLVYSSWDSMREVGEEDPDAHEYNDFALFRIDSASRVHVSPALPEVGGPSGMADAADAGPGTRVRALAGGPVKLLGKDPVTWRDAIVTGRAGEWALLTHAAAPALPGYTGGPVVDAEGRGIGIVVNVGLLPNPGTNGVARLDALLAYAQEHARMDVRLATP